ncbi:hypothetical protein, partial [Paraburkholderia sp.]|uniref:CHASE3 domain-containing protein n=1 Tax=Paraburkholderia sp. TaxID=1926495 RepID=UPI0023A106CB
NVKFRASIYQTIPMSLAGSGGSRHFPDTVCGMFLDTKQKSLEARVKQLTIRKRILYSFGTVLVVMLTMAAITLFQLGGIGRDAKVSSKTPCRASANDRDARGVVRELHRHPATDLCR